MPECLLTVTALEKRKRVIHFTKGGAECEAFIFSIVKGVDGP
ncbi:hypothetical protein [Paenibacillus xylanexedens]|nr:hypothetical protein [Paenibacillus xylanexedens]